MKNRLIDFQSSKFEFSNFQTKQIYFQPGMRLSSLAVGSRKSGRSGVRVYNARLGARRWTGGGGARVAQSPGWGSGGRRTAPARAGSDGGQLWDSICLSSASSQIVGLGNENIIKFCQKVARSRIEEVRSPPINFKFVNQKYYEDRRDWPTTIITKCCK